MDVVRILYAQHIKKNNLSEGNDMKMNLLKLGLLSALLGFAISANAEERIAEIWNCEIEDGKTIDDVQAANGKWLKYINENVEGGDIRSYVLTPIVGKQGAFNYVDSYPNLASWTAGQALEGDAMTAINDELNEVATCSKNTLHRSEPS